MYHAFWIVNHAFKLRNQYRLFKYIWIFQLILQFSYFSVGREWQKGLSLPFEMSTYDYAVVSTLYNRLRCAASPSSSFNITLNLDTNQVRGFLFKARAKLIWPRVSPAMERMIFPLTQVGNYSIKEVQIINPSEVPIIYHLVPMNVYPNSVELVRSLPESFNKGEIKIVDENNFDLHDLTKSVEGKLFCCFVFWKEKKGWFFSFTSSISGLHFTYCTRCIRPCRYSYTKAIEKYGVHKIAWIYSRAGSNTAQTALGLICLPLCTLLQVIFICLLIIFYVYFPSIY